MGERFGMIRAAHMMVKLRYVHEDEDRYGRVRIYFWRKGQPKIRIREEPGTPAFYERYRVLFEQSEAGVPPTIVKNSTKITEGTYRWLTVQFFASVEYQRLQERSQRVQRAILEKTLAEPIAPGRTETFAEFPVARMTSKAIRVLRDRVAAETPEAANNRVRVIRRLFSWAIDNDLVRSNPAREVKYISTGSQGFHTWTVDEVKQFEAKHAIGTKARLALALLLYTGVRRSDAVLLGRQHVRSGWLKFTQQKNRLRRPVTVELPLLPELQRVIEATSTGDLTFLVTQHGKPFSAAGFGNWFRDRCNEAELPHCSAHGLRKAGATILAEKGATPHQLMAIYGWLTIKQAEHYTATANRKGLARAGLGLWTEERTKASHSKKG